MANDEPAVAAATDHGHQVAWDPPSGMSAARRWTCLDCGATVIDYWGNVYGSATEQTCAEYLERYADTGYRT
jgi:hypothetical protein